MFSCELLTVENIVGIRRMHGPQLDVWPVLPFSLISTLIRFIRKNDFWWLIKKQSVSFMVSWSLPVYLPALDQWSGACIGDYIMRRFETFRLLRTNFTHFKLSFRMAWHRDIFYSDCMHNYHRHFLLRNNNANNKSHEHLW